MRDLLDMYVYSILMDDAMRRLLAVGGLDTDGCFAAQFVQDRSLYDLGLDGPGETDMQQFGLNGWV